MPQYALRSPFTNLTVLHAISKGEPDSRNIRTYIRTYIRELFAVIKQSPRRRELRIVEEEYIDFDNLVLLLAEIVRGYCSLKELKIRTRMTFSGYSFLLWACWNLNRLEIISIFHTVGRPDTSHGETLPDRDSQNLDVWIAKNRRSQRQR